MMKLLMVTKTNQYELRLVEIILMMAKWIFFKMNDIHQINYFINYLKIVSIRIVLNTI